MFRKERTHLFSNNQQNDPYERGYETGISCKLQVTTNGLGVWSEDVLEQNEFELCRLQK